MKSEVLIPKSKSKSSQVKVIGSSDAENTFSVGWLGGVAGSSAKIEVEVDATLSFRHSIDGVQILFRVAEKIGIKANLNSSCS